MCMGLQGQTGIPCNPSGECGPFLRAAKSLQPRGMAVTGTMPSAPVLQHTKGGCCTHSLPCQGSSSRPSREPAAANTPLFTKYSWIKALGVQQERQQILRKAKGICSQSPWAQGHSSCQPVAWRGLCCCVPAAEDGLSPLLASMVLPEGCGSCWIQPLFPGAQSKTKTRTVFFTCFSGHFHVC